MRSALSIRPASPMIDRDAATPDADDAYVGRTLAGRYAVRSRIGCGGMGAVYAADDLGTGERVAVKVLTAESADDPLADRFAREVRVVASIVSPHVVRVLGSGRDAGRPFLVMELLAGESLGARLRREHRLPIDEALRVTAQILAGLVRAHAAGVVHRDLKPDNVVLVRHGDDPSFVKIVDFGISKLLQAPGATMPLALTRKGHVMGTPRYMAPEQVRALPDVDGRADVYAAGTILFECLTGQAPHAGPTEKQLLVAICTTDAPDVRAVVPSISEEVAAIVRGALARDRDARFSSAAEMLAAVQAIETSPVTPRTWGGGAGVRARGGLERWAPAVALGMVLVGGLAGLAYGRRVARDEATRITSAANVVMPAAPSAWPEAPASATPIAPAPAASASIDAPPALTPMRRATKRPAATAAAASSRRSEQELELARDLP